MSKELGWSKIHDLIARAVAWKDAVIFVWCGMTAVFAWLGHFIAPIAQYGWAAVVLCGMLSSALIIALLGGGLAGWRYFSPITQRFAPRSEGSAENIIATERNASFEADVVPKSRNFYHGITSVSFDNISDKLMVEIAFFIFNGSDSVVNINEVQGFITYEGAFKSGDEALPLPTPTIRADTGRTMHPWRETLVVLEQRIPRILAETMEKCRVEGMIMFRLDTLTLTATPIGKGVSPIKIPLWGGFSCRKNFSNFTGRNVYGALNETANASG